MRRISVVLPVYNERESIAPCLRGLEPALASEDHEILVCYDTDEDTTLPAIAAMPDRPASVRLVKNTLGRGALNAIRSGFSAATGDVVVTSMADLSDPPDRIPRMAEKIRAGADVVSGSRYMRGGSQRGGPWLKRTLSRIAGVSLRWITGIGTHDSTSNFRAYSKSFLDTVKVESQAGFEIALELTVKAHLAGRRVDEVPSSWVERESGKSNFKLWKWLPSYLRWYLKAAAEPALVLGVWLAMVLSAVHLVAAYASPVPFMDDNSIVQMLGRERSKLAGWLWEQHNEHRLPLPKLLSWAAVAITMDFRAPMYLEVAMLAAAAWLLIGAARRIRGRTRAADAFFPLVFLNWGHFENLLCAFQVAFVLPAAIVAAILSFLAAGPPAPDRRLATRVGTATAALTLCSAAGLLLALPIALWTALAGAAAWRSTDPQRKQAAPRMVLASAVAGILVAICLATYVRPRWEPEYSSLPRAAALAFDLLAWGAGPLEADAHARICALVAALSVTTLAAGVLRWRAHREECWRELGLLACGAGFVALGVGIGLGRGAGVQQIVTPRYVTLFSPFWALLYLAWCRYGTLAGRVVQTGLFVGSALLIPNAVTVGRTFAEGRLRAADLLTRDVDAGMPPETLSQVHWRSFSVDEDRFTRQLEIQRHLGIAPYRTAVPGPPEDPRIVRPFSLWNHPPVEVRSEDHVTRRRILGVWAIQLHAPSEVLFEIPDGVRSVRIGFGVDPLLYSKPETSTKGVRFSVVHLPSNIPGDALFERILDPVERPEDRGIQRVSIPLPEAATGRLEVRVTSARDGDAARDWGFLTDVEFD